MNNFLLLIAHYFFVEVFQNIRDNYIIVNQITTKKKVIKYVQSIKQWAAPRNLRRPKCRSYVGANTRALY